LKFGYCKSLVWGYYLYVRYTLILLFINTNAMAQAIYDTNGQYRGYQQTSPSGVTNTYNAQGQNTGSSQIDNGQTNHYSPAGRYQGTNTATPVQPQVNTAVNTPRQAPQVPTIKGW
jgi:hypothetical protein